MAVINSLGVGAGTKSAGNITYAHYRGRTIAKQRITTNKSNTVLQQTQRVNFADVNFLARGFASVLPVFDKTRYGYQQNKFIRLNYDQLLNYIKTHDDWKPSSTPIDAAVAYVTTYLPNVATRNAAVELPIFTAYNLRRTIKISVAADASQTISAKLDDPWKTAKKVTLRLVRLLPHPDIPYVTDVEMQYGSTQYSSGWYATYTPVAETVNVRPLFAATILVDDVPCSSFWAIQTKYTPLSTLEEALEIQEAPPALSARKRARK